ncbi:MAG: hypothetical protein ACPL0F_07805, partial [bacterium]
PLLERSYDDTSNKTRIETGCFRHLWDRVAAVMMTLPTKQGLKRGRTDESLYLVLTVMMTLPTKQGLKLHFAPRFFSGLRVMMTLPTKQGLKLGAVSGWVAGGGVGVGFRRRWCG